MHCFGRWDLTLGAHCRTGALSQRVRERAPHEKHDHRPSLHRDTRRCGVTVDPARTVKNTSLQAMGSAVTPHAETFKN